MVLYRRGSWPAGVTSLWWARGAVQAQSVQLAIALLLTGVLAARRRPQGARRAAAAAPRPSSSDTGRPIAHLRRSRPGAVRARPRPTRSRSCCARAASRTPRPRGAVEGLLLASWAPSLIHGAEESADPRPAPCVQPGRHRRDAGELPRVVGCCSGRLGHLAVWIGLPVLRLRHSSSWSRANALSRAWRAQAQHGVARGAGGERPSWGPCSWRGLAPQLLSDPGCFAEHPDLRDGWAPRSWRAASRWAAVLAQVDPSPQARARRRAGPPLDERAAVPLMDGTRPRAAQSEWTERIPKPALRPHRPALAGHVAVGQLRGRTLRGDPADAASSAEAPRSAWPCRTAAPPHATARPAAASCWCAWPRAWRSLSCAASTRWRTGARTGCRCWAAPSSSVSSRPSASSRAGPAVGPVQLRVGAGVGRDGRQLADVARWARATTS